MSSTTCFTKGHSTRIAPPCGSYCRVTERFGLKILFAGLFFVLLFGLFAVPVAATDDLSPTLRVLTVDDVYLVSIDGGSGSVDSPLIFAIDIPAHANIMTDSWGYAENVSLDILYATSAVGEKPYTVILIEETVGNTFYVETNGISGHVFPAGEYQVRLQYLNSDGNVCYSNTVSFSLVEPGTTIALSGFGTEESPYLIQSSADLKLLSDEVKSGKTFADTYFAITNDIDLSSYTDWQPIGDFLVNAEVKDYASPYLGLAYIFIPSMFQGKIDGKEHTISHLTIEGALSAQNFDFNGLFGVVGPGAVIQNIKLTDVSVSSNAARYTGGLIGGIYCYFGLGSDTVIIENCHVEGEINGNGGLIGRAYSDLAPIRISGCSVDISGVVDGGLIGEIFAPDISVSNSYAKSEFTSHYVEAGFIGSLCGTGENVIISNCYAEGNCAVAGFIRSIHNQGSPVSITVKNCYSTIDITTETDWCWAGLVNNIHASDSNVRISIKNSVSLSHINGGTEYARPVGDVTGVAGSSIYSGLVYSVSDVPNNYADVVSPSDAVTQTFYEDTLGWDFDTVWKMDSSVSPYPILQQISTSEPVEEYTITFDSNGGTGSMGSATVSAGESYTLPECTFTAPDGQVFKAWLIGSTEYAAGTSYTPTASVTVKAVWTVEDTTAPGIFTINPLENGIVSWTVSEGATGYKFSLRDRTISETEDTGKKVNNEDVGTATNYDISSYLVEGHSYRVAVCAYNDAGKETWVELEFGDCQHTTAVNVDITYNGITKDFPQDTGDGRTHYWYVNKVCDDCKTVLESNVQSTAIHNANTLEKNGVCECNYHTITAELSKIMYAVEDTNTYLVPEASDGYHGGSIDKDEEVTVLAEGLGVDGSWSLIQYSVTGTSREKVRFVKSESLVANDDEVVVTIFYPTDDYVHLSNEKLEIHWIASKNDVEKYEVDVFLESDTKSLIYHNEIQGVDGNYNYECELSEELLSTLIGTKSYKIVVTALSSTGLILGENTVSFKVKHPFNFPDDTWGFSNSQYSFKPFIETIIVQKDTSSQMEEKYYFTWEDFSTVCGDDYISQTVYLARNKWGGSCAAMVSSIIAVNNNLFPIDGFSKGSKTYTSLSEITSNDMFATHDYFSASAKNLGHYLLQLQIYQMSLPVQDTYYINGLDRYDYIISSIERGELVLIAMCKKTSASKIMEAAGSHAILGYDVEITDLGSGLDVVKIHVYDPNYPFENPYLELYRQNGDVTSWWYSKNMQSSQYYESEYHRLGYLSEQDVNAVYFDNYLGGDKFKFKSQDELIYVVKFIDDTETKLYVINRDSEMREIILLYGDESNSDTGNLYRIPKEEIQLLSTDGGTAVIVDDHSSVELTLDAGTTASVIVDDTKESSVEITSDDENTNHEFTVTYGYDSTADKGYQEATVKGTMSDSFKGEATENGLKLTGLDSAEILVENSKGESVSVGTIQNADEYEDIVIDIDTSVKVTGNKDGVSDVLVSVPLNKVQYESSGSSKDTGSGNYAEYPRIVTNGGYVDFGTSPVVKGVTLPKGVNGKVVLIAKSKTSAPEGKEAYGVFEINVESYPTGEKAVISFTIPLSDLQKKGFTEKDICLYHFDGEVWTKLLTTYTVEGDKVFYEAETTAFSPFAIVYEKDGATSAAVSEIPVEPEKPSDETVSTVPEVPSSSEPQETESPAPVLGMTLGALGAAVLMRRK